MKELKAVHIQGSTLIGISRSDYIMANVLAANVAEVVTIPTDAQYVLFSANTDFYARFNAAAAVPATESTDGTASMLNPALRQIDGASTIGLISPYACVVTMAFYS